MAPSTGAGGILELLGERLCESATVELGVARVRVCSGVAAHKDVSIPVLKRWHEGLAVAYVGFRSLEAVLLFAIEAELISLIDVSRNYLDSTGTEALTAPATNESARLAMAARNSDRPVSHRVRLCSGITGCRL